MENERERDLLDEIRDPLRGCAGILGWTAIMLLFWLIVAAVWFMITR